MTLPKIEQLRKLLPQLGPDDAWELDNLIHATIDLHTPGMPDLDPFRKALLNMAPRDVSELRKALETERAKKEKDEARAKSEAPPALNEEGVWTLRQEKVFCGKPNCGKPHGPYWYGYRTLGGRTKKQYFGKKKPTPAKLDAAAAAMVEKEIARVEAAAAKKAAKTAKKKKAPRR